MSAEIALMWDQIRPGAGPYPPAAFAFVQDGLRYTVDRLTSESLLPDPDNQHISGQQLCMGLRDFAIDQFGPLAKTVLNHWSIFKTEDFGRIVFAMVDAGLMRKSESDRSEDFEYVFDFEDAFERQPEFC